MALKQDKYDIEVRYDVQSSGWIIYGWNNYFDRYNKNRSIEESECSVNWNTGQRKKVWKQKKGRYIQAFYKNTVLWIRQPKQVEQQATPLIQILMRTYHNGLKQVVVKRKRLECLIVGETLTLRIQTNKWKEVVLNRKRLKYISVSERVTLKL